MNLEKLKQERVLGPLMERGQFEAINLIYHRMATLKKSRLLLGTNVLYCVDITAEFLSLFHNFVKIKLIRK